MCSLVGLPSCLILESNHILIPPAHDISLLASSNSALPLISAIGLLKIEGFRRRCSETMRKVLVAKIRTILICVGGDSIFIHWIGRIFWQAQLDVDGLEPSSFTATIRTLSNSRRPAHAGKLALRYGSRYCS